MPGHYSSQKHPGPPPHPSVRPPAHDQSVNDDRQIQYGRSERNYHGNGKKKRHNPFEGHKEADGSSATPETRSRRNK